MEHLKVPGYSILILSGNGFVIEGVGEDLIQYYAVLTKNLRVELNGEDITDKVSTSERSQFLASKFLEDIYDGEFFYGDDEMELPRSIFLLPKDTKIEDLELIPINGDFRDWDKGGIVADFIYCDGEELQAQSYLNNGKGLPELPVFNYEGNEFDNNQELYSNYYSEDNETTAYRVY